MLILYGSHVVPVCSVMVYGVWPLEIVYHKLN